MFFLFFLSLSITITIAHSPLQNTISHHIHNKLSHFISLNHIPTSLHQCILDSLIHQQFSHILVLSQNTYPSKIIFQQLTPPHQKHHLLNIKYSHNLLVSNIVKPTSLLFIENYHPIDIQQFCHFKKIILINTSSTHDILVIKKKIKTPQIPP